MSPPPLDITPAKDAIGWAERLDGKLIDRRTIRREFDGDITALDGYEDGAWWIQDAAAARPHPYSAILPEKTPDLAPRRAARQRS